METETAGDPTQPAACEYHKRPGCQACNSLRIALKAEAAGKQSLAEGGFRKAVQHEQAGV